MYTGLQLKLKTNPTDRQQTQVHRLELDVIENSLKQTSSSDLWTILLEQIKGGVNH